MRQAEQRLDEGLFGNCILFNWPFTLKFLVIPSPPPPKSSNQQKASTQDSAKSPGGWGNNGKHKNHYSLIRFRFYWFFHPIFQSFFIYLFKRLLLLFFKAQFSTKLNQLFNLVDCLIHRVVRWDTRYWDYFGFPWDGFFSVGFVWRLHVSESFYIVAIFASFDFWLRPFFHRLSPSIFSAWHLLDGKGSFLIVG